MGKKILIIDDSEQDSKIIQRVLNELGFDNILVADRGETGIKIAKAEKPDLILIDTMLPCIDGFEVCMALRKIKELDSAKLIIMTGFIDVVDAVKAKEYGADDYVVKTMDSALIIKAVKEHFNLK